MDKQVLDSFPKHKDHLREQLQNDKEYAKMWLNSTLEEIKDLADSIYSYRVDEIGYEDEEDCIVCWSKEILEELKKLLPDK